MKTQSLTLKQKEPAFIETPGGVVEIEWVSSKKVQVRLPEAMVAWKGESRAAGKARFLTFESNGRCKPRYNVLVPVLDQNGYLLDVASPEVLRIGGAGPPSEKAS